MNLFKFCIFCFSVFCLSLSNANAQEKILAYDVLIKINEDASINVNERITLNVEHQNINLGIYRKIPTVVRTENKKYITPVTVNFVKLDGNPENFWIVKGKNENTVEIGAKKFDGTNKVSKGIHTYELNWTSSGHLRSFDTFDEIYFNVTGNDWIFPIETARAIVLLPNSVEAIQHSGYYGPKGSNAKAISRLLNPQTVEFYAPYLHKGEGLTVAVGFSKGIENIVHISSVSPLIQKIMDLGIPFLTPRTISLFIIFTLVLAYYIFMWRKYGRDGEIGPITPIFSPPSDISPAEAEIIMRGKRYREDKAFMASILNLATNKYIKIENKNIVKEENGYTPSFKEEKEILDTTFSKQKKIPLGKFNPKFGDAYVLFCSALKKMKKTFVKENNFTIKYGILLNFALFFIIPGAKEVGFPFILASIISLFYIPFYMAAFSCIKSKAYVAGIFMLLFIIPHSSAFIIFMPLALLSSIDDVVLYDKIGFIFFAVSFVILHFTFYYLMDKPYPHTTQKISKLLGLKMFMEITEKNRYNQITPSIFEKNLPYAVIFGIENEWIKKMKDLDPTYTPDWYEGKEDFSSSSIPSLASSFSKASSRPQTNRGSGGSRSSGGFSSGSSGGGSSGGGSGGGGGGGR